MRQYLPLIQICNPEKLSNEELLQVQTKLYQLPPEELMREKEVLPFLRRVVYFGETVPPISMK